eukprot:TRINITY_DN931_c1_g1_i3.p1 TRINITY_DN931_c1_g1~~TRINITY_DN931_c1_g1_i3.p1  ORF type:complete len:119 (-),score=12.97 TRINITY_DN931_c1_g1_i3:66-422(-)
MNEFLNTGFGPSPLSSSPLISISISISVGWGDSINQILDQIMTSFQIRTALASTEYTGKCKLTMMLLEKIPKEVFSLPYVEAIRDLDLSCNQLERLPKVRFDFELLLVLSAAFVFIRL